MDISSRCHDACDVLVDELESKLGKFARINNFPEPHASDENDTSDAGEESEELEPYRPEPVKKSLEKCATFPCGSKLSDEGDEEPEMSLWLLFSEEFVQRPYSHPLSMPLVSAMKGSREKLGLSPRNLKVTWAADVYDPIPNSLSHTVKGKQKKSRKDNNNHKKLGKKGQKGNLPKGGGKDKKQFHKHGGRSDKCYRTMDSLDADDLDGLDVGGQEYCGSSLWKKSPSRIHCSVAEAL